MAKQIDINGLQEFKKKCDETYAKVGQGGGGGGIKTFYTEDFGETFEQEVFAYLGSNPYNTEMVLINLGNMMFFLVYPGSMYSDSSNRLFISSIMIYADRIPAPMPVPILKTKNGNYTMVIEEFFNETIDLQEAQKTTGQTLTYNTQFYEDDLDNYLRFGFLSTFPISAGGIYYYLPLVGKVSTDTIMYNGTITTTDNGVVKQQILTLTYSERKWVFRAIEK